MIISPTGRLSTTTTTINNLKPTKGRKRKKVLYRNWLNHTFHKNWLTGSTSKEDFYEADEISSFEIGFAFIGLSDS